MDFESTTKPILSIVIPTKNRYSTLEVVIEGLVLWKDKDVEIIIQDNSNDNTSIKLIIEKISDSRIKYFYTKESITAPENCNKAIKNANGEYVCFIGDDDGVAHEAIRLTRWMLENNIDSAYLNVATYAWPDLEDKNHGFKFSGQMKIFNNNCKLLLTDPYKELEKLLKSGALIIPAVPRVYQGIVRKSCLEALYMKTGTYFPGPVPDMSNAVGLVPFVKKHLFADYPFVIAGAAGHSMAGKGALKKHHNALENEKTLPNDTIKYWSNILPKYWSAQTIWAEGALKALDAVGLSDWAIKLNIEQTLAACLMYVPDFRAITFSKIRELKSKKIVSRRKILYYFIKICLVRIRSYVNAILRNTINVDLDNNYSIKCENVKDAMILLDEYNLRNPIKYDVLLLK